jgi:hypothetical protein
VKEQFLSKLLFGVSFGLWEGVTIRTDANFPVWELGKRLLRLSIVKSG